ncbi:MAG TPA: histidine phosphatase family protein [Actinomycetota bacterium]|nr:histidine phosphatase family protein [Actinomycetota bacterium]
MTTIYLVRHGETEWNHSKLAQGQADIDLNEAGYRQAIGTADGLSHVPVDAVYASDLKRAYRTAEPIAKTHGLSVETDPAFREIDQGEWEGLHVDEIRRRWPELWGPARHWSARPGGESPGQVRERALKALAKVVEAHPHGNVVIVSHGGTIRWLSAEALGYDDRRSARIRGLGNGAVVRMTGEMQDGRLALRDLERLDGNTTDLDDPND